MLAWLLFRRPWDWEKLLAEVDRIEEMVRAYLSNSQKRSFKPDRTRQFTRTRRAELMEEIKDGMPRWPPAGASNDK